MPALEEQIGPLLRARGLRLAAAESCTGGLVAHRLTNIAGSSDYFPGGIVAYANEVKIKALDVSPQTLKEHGAVSRETVIEMARGARNVFGADIAVSVSGIAGPGGGTPEKPVGMAWIGLSTPEGDWARDFRFSGSRGQNKASSAEAALQFVLDYLQGTLDKTLA
jgi:PncC family amidohydrolase